MQTILIVEQIRIYLFVKDIPNEDIPNYLDQEKNYY